LRQFTKKRSGYLVEPQNQDRRLGGRRRHPKHQEASMPADTWRDCRAYVGRTRTAATAWPCDEEECYMSYLPLRGLYHNLSVRGSLVFCPARRDSYILTLGFLGKPSFRTASHFPCSIGLHFSPVCKESDLRVNGSLHCCVDLLLVARVIFVSFSSYFCWIFVHALLLRL
jgi:hypothetical protein